MVPLVLTSASAQYPSGGQYPTQMPSAPQVQQVTGKYTDTTNGFSITIPDGWQGQAMAFQGQAGSTVPYSYSMVTAQPYSNGSPTSEQVAMIVYFYKVPTQQNVPQSTYVPPSAPPMVPSNVPCTYGTQQNVNVNGINAFKFSYSCPGYAQGKWEGYAMQLQNGYAMVMLGGDSSSYDKYVSAFENSVNTFASNGVSAAAAQPSNATTPEFPATVGIVMAIITGLVILVTRTRLSLSFGNPLR